MSHKGTGATAHEGIRPRWHEQPHGGGGDGRVDENFHRIID